MKKNVLLIGHGGREHAIFKALARSKQDLDIWQYPGSIAISDGGGKVVKDKIGDWHDLAGWASNNKIDLTVVGSETPLVEGIVDVFNEKNLAIFGPSKCAARIEGSKEFAKKLMRKYNIPTADWESFSDQKSAEKYLDKVGAPIVVKYSGLASGKGVTVCETIEEAKRALQYIFEYKSYGDEECCVVIEEVMFGEEASIFVLTDGTNYKILPPAQDHKRIFDGDRGPNTGGMGAYAPAPIADKKLIEEVEKNIIIPVLDAMKKEGNEYRGLLYVGIMATKTGPRVIEFNCRFGDPETEAVLPLVNCDWYDAFYASAKGGVENVDWEVSQNYSATVVIASKGYPASAEKGITIYGLDDAKNIENVEIFHAGTDKNRNGEIVTNGGRVLAVTAWDETLQKAVDRAYLAVGKINFDGMQYRKDIAKKGLKHF